jgi:hypothetical protein
MKTSIKIILLTILGHYDIINSSGEQYHSQILPRKKLLITELIT